jgi:hypothetical protein
LPPPSSQSVRAIISPDVPFVNGLIQAAAGRSI